MTDITAKPFDWNDNLSKEAIEDFEVIRKDLSYCSCQNIGMALAKLELLEKQGCKVIDSSVSSSEKPKSEWQQDHEILKAYSDGASAVLDKISAEIADLEEGISSYHNDRPWVFKDEVLQIIDRYKAEGSEE